MRRASKISAGGGAQKDRRTREIVGACLDKAREFDVKVALSADVLERLVLSPLDAVRLEQIRYFQGHLSKHIDLVDRRLLQGQSIPHEEKVFSLFEPHTEWIVKGKSRPAVELGHQLLLTTDGHQLIVDYKVMENTRDAAETLPLARRLLKRFGPDAIGSMSFDKGFSPQSDREELAEKIALVVMPKKGRHSQADREREGAAAFVKLRKAHSAVESNINSLEHHGLNRCPDKGLEGFKRYVGLGVLSYNLHRLGREKIARDRQGAQGQRPKARAA
ncbi:MAG: IS5 family transposase [Limisphaerales bacterium]|jgi:IS5 family transposase